MAIDHHRRVELLSRVRELAGMNREWQYQNYYAGPVVSLEEFFEGNDDPLSMKFSYRPQLSLRTIYQLLRQIRERSEVQDVLVQIFDTFEDRPDRWPYAEIVLVLASAELGEVKKWLAPGDPNAVWEGMPFLHGCPLPTGLPTLKPSVKIFTVWWE